MDGNGDGTGDGTGVAAGDDRLGDPRLGGLGEQARHGGGVRDAAQRRPGVAHVPRADMRPGHQVGEPDVLGQREGDGAGAAAPKVEPRRADLPVGQVQRHRQRRADPHPDAPVGQRVDGRARLHPGDAEDHRAGRRADGEERKRVRQGGRCRHLRQGDGDPPDRQKGEVARDPAELERLAGQAPGVGRALPEDPLARRQGLGQPAHGLEGEIVVMRAHRVTSGPEVTGRSGVGAGPGAGAGIGAGPSGTASRA